MANVAVVGAQWGDEGKGKITDLLGERADVVVRYGGGNNAGHTVKVGDKTYKLHLVPSGILYPKTRCFVGNGTVLDPASLLWEMEGLRKEGLGLENLFISPLATLILPYHKVLDKAEEEHRRHKIGTTGRGIGPAYGDKYLRFGIRVVDLLDEEVFRERLADSLGRANDLLTKVYGQQALDFEAIAAEYLGYAEQLRPYVADTSLLLHEAIQRGEKVLFEGAQGIMLDVDMGTYPFVTSSYPVSGGAAVGSGVGPSAIDRSLGIAKAYCTRVGGGPFPSELTDATGDELRRIGAEFGTTTGRPRRCGWFDAVAVRLAARASSLDGLAITKLDVLDTFAEIQVVTAYKYQGETLVEFPHTEKVLAQCEPVFETLPGWQTPTSGAKRWEDLPKNAQAYLNRIAELTGVPVSIVSVGPERDATLIVEDLLAAPRRK